jgi:hypothetical protein
LLRKNCFGLPARRVACKPSVNKLLPERGIAQTT